MTRAHTAFAFAAAAAALPACATAGQGGSAGVDAGDPSLPEHLAGIPIYWAGHAPQCPTTPRGYVSATSRAGLRQAAYEHQADAVVDGQMRAQLVDRQVVSRNLAALPGVSYVYLGMAVRLAAKCRA